MQLLYFTRYLFTFIVIPLLLGACTQQAKQRGLPSTILAIQQTGKLATAEYTLTKIIRASDNQTWYKVGDRKLLMSCEAHLKAGVDLQQIDKNNFDVEADSIMNVVLPHAQLFNIGIPPNRIQVAYQDVDVLRDPFSVAEREQLLVQAERQIKGLTDSLGILKTAETNAVIYLQHLLQQAGYKQVNVTFK